jgi:hypothetical protein
MKQLKNRPESPRKVPPLLEMCHRIRYITSHVDANIMESVLNHTSISRLVKPHNHNSLLVLNGALSSKGCALLRDRFIPTWLEVA